MLDDIIVIVVLLCVIGGILFYLYRNKKRGNTCVGCPYAKQCGGKCSENAETKEE